MTVNGRPIPLLLLLTLIAMGLPTNEEDERLVDELIKRKAPPGKTRPLTRRAKR